jgi:hypothetical protein
MSQKSSVPQAISFVSQVLKGDKHPTSYTTADAECTFDQASCKVEIEPLMIV